MSNNHQSNKPNNQQPRQQQQATTTAEATKEAAAAASEQAQTTTSPSEDKANDDLTSAAVTINQPGTQDLGTADKSTASTEVAKPLVVNSTPQEKEIGVQDNQRPVQQNQAAFAKATPAAPRVNIPAVPVVRKREVEGLGIRNPLDTTPISEVVAAAKNLNLSAFYEKLQHLDRSLSDKVQTTPEEAAKLMQQTYQVLVNIVERSAADSDFANHWNLAMRMITETPDGGFSAARLWRGKPYWALGKEKFDHFEAVWNLIDASVRHRSEYRSFVNQRRVMVGFSGGAQGRLGIFYRSFN